MLLLYSFFVMFCCIGFVFFFKQKTAYEMRISDWSSDVCSSDLTRRAGAHRQDGGGGLDVAAVLQRRGRHVHRHFQRIARLRQGLATRRRLQQPLTEQQYQVVIAQGRQETSRQADGSVVLVQPGDRKSTRLNSSH